MKRATHRPKRAYPDAPIHRTQVALDQCPFCGFPLVSTRSREVDKYVQTMAGPRHVIGYSSKCSNSACLQPQTRYHATQGAKLSLPHVTYGLDVMAYIAHRRNGEQKQFKEIWRELRIEYQVEISEREVGLLYRKIQALLMGGQEEIHQELTATVQKYGRLLMAVDGLQPDGGGPKLYVLHEILGGTLISVALIDQANEDNLTEWLAPYREWRGMVQATLSDNEKALVAALAATWPEARHQLCQMHFVKNLSEPVHAADRELQQGLREAMGRLPPVPTPQKATEAEQGPEVVSAHRADDSTSEQDRAPAISLPSPALMQALDVISGVEAEILDTITGRQGYHVPGTHLVSAGDSGHTTPGQSETFPLRGVARLRSIAGYRGTSDGSSSRRRTGCLPVQTARPGTTSRGADWLFGRRCAAGPGTDHPRRAPAGRPSAG